VITDIDVDARRLGYFHNAGYYTLDGEDFDRTFRIDQAAARSAGDDGAGPQTIVDPTFMPFFAELVRLDRIVRRPSSELAAISGKLLTRHLARRPIDNPIERFAARFSRELPELQGRGLAHYHAW